MIKFNKTFEEVELVTSVEDHRVANRLSCLDMEQFTLYSIIDSQINPRTVWAKKPGARVTCRIARNPSFYYWNVFMTLVGERIDFGLCLVNYNYNNRFISNISNKHKYHNKYQ